MKKEDLTQIKNVGAVRMKFLNESGITTIKQLYETPLQKLSQIKSIGQYYAKLIKNSVTEIYEKKPQKPVSKPKASKEKKFGKVNQNLQKQIQIVRKRLKQANENLKPLGKKKYLKSYIDFKKKSKTLRGRLKVLEKKQGDLSNKTKKKIIKNAAVLEATLKTAGKKPTKKNYKMVIKEIQSFSRLIK